MMDVTWLTGEWMVVLPDHPDSFAAAHLISSAPCRVNHPSGRPWLVGSWDAADLNLGTPPNSSVAVATLGLSAATSQELSEMASRARDAYDLDNFRPAGCFHLIASLPHGTRIQGTLSGLRRVFCARFRDITIAATRSDILAALVNGDIDKGQLAIRLLVSELALTSLSASMWTKVQAVEDDTALILSPGGSAALHRRWTPPDAHLETQEAGELLRVALLEAVQVRVASGQTLSSDLSGGLDSTTLCFIASREGLPLTTLTMLECDVGDDDPYWADLAAEYLPNLERIKIAQQALPLHYSDIDEAAPASEEPYSCLENRAAFRAIAKLIRRAGSEMHMTGDGGDETLMGGASGVFETFRRKPLMALRHLHAYRSLEHWRWRDIFSHALERRLSYSHWLIKRANEIHLSPLEDQDEENVIQMPPWATTEAVELVRDKLLEEAETSSSRWHGWTAHHTIWGVRQSASMVRSSTLTYAEEGVRVTSPFLDDNVIDACMAAAPHVRSTPWSYKPLLREAMREIVPSPNLNRTTKAEGSNIEYQGLRVHTEKLVALCDDCRLEEMGLIDPHLLRTTCTSLNLSVFMPYAISITMSSERWLRDLCPVIAKRGRKMSD